MKYKIIEYWIKNQDYTYKWIAELFNYPIDKVERIIRNYEKEPYIIRESKL